MRHASSRCKTGVCALLSDKHLNGQTPLILNRISIIDHSKTMDFLIKTIAYISIIVIVFVIITRATWADSQKDTHGKLHFGAAVLNLVFVTTILVLGLAFALFKTNQAGHNAPIWFLFMVATAVALAAYFWAEYICTRGYFTEEGICFQSIWKGKRCYLWSELDHVVFDKNMMWYVFDFGDGRKIYISMLLCGHLEIFEILDELGYLQTTVEM